MTELRGPRLVVAGPFLVVCLIWGTTPIVIKAGLLAGWPPLWFCAARLLLSAALLAPLLSTRFAGAPLGPAGRRVVWPIGVFGMAVNFGLAVWGQQYIGAALASLLVGTQPITTTVIVHAVRRDPPTWRFVASLAAGIAGLLVIFRGGAMLGPHALVGAAAFFAGVTIYGATFVYVNERVGGLNLLRVAAGQNLIGGVLVAAAAVLLEGAPDAPTSLSAWTSFGYLALFSSIVALVLANWLIGRLGAARFSFISFITPLVGLLASVVVLGEELDGSTLVGAVAIGIALLLALGPGARASGQVPVSPEELPLATSGPSSGRARWRRPRRPASAGTAAAADRR